MKANGPASGKTPTGITGFDEMTGGGMPRGRTTLLVGGSGSGKTIFATQFLAHGARHCREHGIFVAFEESPARIVANMHGFGWKLPELLGRKLAFVDAQPDPDFVQSGEFDLAGMLAALSAKTAEIGAKRIVFDAMDIMLALLPDAAARRREVYRLHAWLLAHGLTGLITARQVRRRRRGRARPAAVRLHAVPGRLRCHAESPGGHGGVAAQSAGAEIPRFALR